MADTRSDRPLDSSGRPIDDFHEWDGAEVDDAHLVARLRLWTAPEPSPADGYRLLQKLLPLVPGGSSVRRSVKALPRSPWRDLVWIVSLARLQATVVRPAFWITSACVALLGILLALGPSRAPGTLLLYIGGPLLGYLATASAFREQGLGLLECELACPPSSWHLTLARLAVVLGYLLALGIPIGVTFGAKGADGPMAVTLHWLAPMLLGVGLTLCLSLRFPLLPVASAVYGVWLAGILAAWLASDGAWSPAGLGAPREMLLAALGCALLFLTLACSRRPSGRRRRRVAAREPQGA